jgi:hypothetical protein
VDKPTSLRAPKKDQNKTKGKIANRVLIVSAEVKDKDVKAYNEAHLNGDAEVVRVTEPEDLERELGKYESISQLTVMVHSSIGDFLFGDQGDGTFKKNLSIPDLAKRLRTSQRTRVQILDLASCNIGLDPQPALDLGLALNATEVTAWNHFHAIVAETLHVSKDNTAEDIDKVLIPLAGYVTVDKDAILARAKASNGTISENVLVEWFKVDLEPGGLPKPFPKRDQIFKKISAKQDITITNAIELKSIQEELKQFKFMDPQKPLYRIVIRTSGFAESQSTPDAGTKSSDGGT